MCSTCLRKKEQNHGLAEVSQYWDHCKSHPSPVAKCVADKHSSGILKEKNSRWSKSRRLQCLAFVCVQRTHFVRSIKCKRAGEKGNKEVEWKHVVPALIQATYLKFEVIFPNPNDEQLKTHTPTCTMLKTTTLNAITIACPLSSPLIPKRSIWLLLSEVFAIYSQIRWLAKCTVWSDQRIGTKLPTCKDVDSICAEDYHHAHEHVVENLNINGSGNRRDYIGRRQWRQKGMHGGWNNNSRWAT